MTKENLEFEIRSLEFDIHLIREPQAMKKEKQECCPTLNNQNGVSLVIALLILLVLTLIGISAISTTNFETNIAGNERLYNRAFYTADSGVDYFVSNGSSYVALAKTTGTVDSQADGISLGGDYFLVNWSKTPLGVGYPQKYEFKITSTGISPSFPTAGRIEIEAVVEAADTTPPPGYPGGS